MNEMIDPHVKMIRPVIPSAEGCEDCLRIAPAPESERSGLSVYPERQPGAGIKEQRAKRKGLRVSPNPTNISLHFAH
jgi:hypothetical protein